MPYRLAIPQYERQGMSETYLSPKGVKSMRKQLMTRRALRSRTAVVRILVSSTVERIGAIVRAVRRVPNPPLTRFNQKWRTESNRSSPVFRLRVYYTPTNVGKSRDFQQKLGFYVFDKKRYFFVYNINKINALIKLKGVKKNFMCGIFFY